MKFYLLSSPIGHLDDVSLNFLQTVSGLNYLAVEDSRVSAKLLQLLQAKFPKYRLWPKELISVAKEKERRKSAQILDLLSQGTSVGYLSDAGTPAIADPGAYLVDQVRRSHYQIEAIPGPSALTLALSLCGFEADLTLFLGFFPKKPARTIALLKNLSVNNLAKSVNLVFFDSPLRIRKTTQLLFTHFPQAGLFLGRELTKKFEELLWFQKNSFNPEVLKTKGEYTAVFNLRMV